MAELMGLRDGERGLKVYQLLCGEDVAVPTAGGAEAAAAAPMTLENLVGLGATIGMEVDRVMALLDAINGDLEATAGYLREDGATDNGAAASAPLTAEQQAQRQYKTAAQMANFVYVIHDAETGEAATVDAAWDTDGILRFVASLGASVTAALYTHRHEDHVGGRSPRSGNLRAGAVNMAAAGATVYCMDADADSVERSTEALVTRLADGGTVQLGAHTITAIATPGHTPGSCCYLAGTAGGTLESEVVFTGDTLFVGGFGRMSIEAGTGDVSAMFNSLGRLAQLPLGTAVLAGHHFGAQRITSIGDEVRHNAAYRCTSAEQLAALAGIASSPTTTRGPIRMTPSAGMSSQSDDVLDGLDFSGCVLPEPGPQCFCCQPMEDVVLRRRATFFCEDVNGSEPSSEQFEQDEAIRDLYWWSPVPKASAAQRKGGTPSFLSVSSHQHSPSSSRVQGSHSVSPSARRFGVANGRLKRINRHIQEMRVVGVSAAFRRGSGREKQLTQETQDIEEYHMLTKHGFPDRYAAGPSDAANGVGVDWNDQPDSCRRFIGATEMKLPRRDGRSTHWGRRSSGMALRDGAAQIPPAFLAAEQVEFSALFSLDGQIAPQNALTADAISSFLHHSLAKSATKVGGDDEWNLRVVASSGNLHGTELYVFLPEGMLSDDEEEVVSAGTTNAAATRMNAICAHYNVDQHSLVRRASWPKDVASAQELLFESGCFLISLSVVHWRQAWKYGDRGWRYSELDVGHALCALRMSAQLHGWSLRVLSGVPDTVLASLVGIDRVEDFQDKEGESPVMIIMVGPPGAAFGDLAFQAVQTLATTEGVVWEGTALPLGDESTHHEFASSSVIAAAIEASKLSAQDAHEQAEAQEPARLTLLRTNQQTQDTATGMLTASSVIRTRRSIWRMVPDASEITFVSLCRILGRVMAGGPHQPPAAPPFDCGLSGPQSGACSHLLIFVHRIQGLPPGLYMLVRDMNQLDVLMQELSPEFGWSLCAPKQDDETGAITGARAIPRGPERAVETLQLLASGVLPLFCLAVGDVQDYAKQAFCHQDVASDGSFAVAMIAPLAVAPVAASEDGSERPTPVRGRWYREALWECGLISQCLYLACEAEAQHLHGTALGCMFDDAIGQVLGLSRDSRYACLHGFACGAGIVGELNDDDAGDEPTGPVH